MKSAKLLHEETASTEQTAIEHAESVRSSRRSFFKKLGVGAFLASIGGQGYAFLRSLVPNVLYEDPQQFKIGLPASFAEGSTFLEAKRVFVFREKSTYYAISASCPHLGCTVKMVNLSQPREVKIKNESIEEKWEFQCPCHGSKYHANGTNYAGPAPRPLTWVKLEVAPEDGQLVVNLGESVNQDFRLTV